MRDSLIKLHIAVFLAGFTAMFGKLINLDEFVLVWYRLMFVSIILFVILGAKGKLKLPDIKSLWKLFLVGTVIGIHWVTFYGSVIKSNISIGVVCFSLCGFFSALLEPIILKKRFSIREFILGTLTVFGLLLIFSFDTQYRVGIVFGVVSALLASLFTVLNKKYYGLTTSSNILFYEMLSGFLSITIAIPFYLYIFPSVSFSPTSIDLIYLLILTVLCTIVPWLFQIQCMRDLSAFTVNLTYNLEPLYSILIAFIFFNEAKELNIYFYIGLTIIIFTIVYQSIKCWKDRKFV